jgi:hypothetical protein
LSVLWITASDYSFDILWPLYCLSFELRLLITFLIYFGHCIVCPLNYGFLLPIWNTLAIALPVLWITASDYPFDILWPLYCQSFELRIWLPFWYTLAIVLSVLWITASDYPFDILWPLYCLSFELRLLVTSLIYFGHCIVCPLNYGFWLPIWYTLAIVLSVLWITASNYPFDILWPLYFLSFELRLLITPLIYIDHCIACPLNYGFWLPIWYLLAIVLSVLWITTSNYPFDILWPLYCLFFELRLLITSLISSNDSEFKITRFYFT